LLQRYGDDWDYSLTINDLPFDFMAPALISAGKSQAGYPRNISAGDGSEAAFQRIKQNFYQYATVAEPLNLHGWQTVDEMNRAFAGEEHSGYVVPVHLFTPDNILEDGGDKLSYDPGNGYRDVYRDIWGVN
jgi:ribose transport system substrate-binding protein